MLKSILLFIFYSTPLFSLGQSKGDTKIIVSLNDTTGVYDKVKLTLIKNNFIVKEDKNKDTLSTYPSELQTLPGTAVVWAVINEHHIELSGIYSLKKLNYFGMTKPGKNSNQIMFYRGSKTWKVLERIAGMLGGQIAFSK
ncbi:MAG: hypothetical protein ABIP35_10930 [Ginsengibacter sp.]